MEHTSTAPSTTRELPEDYVELVKRVHESGGYGSRGYGVFLSLGVLLLYLTTKKLIKLFIYLFFPRYMYDWKREEANKNLLRTHTTAVSTRMLYALAKV